MSDLTAPMIAALKDRVAKLISSKQISIEIDTVKFVNDTPETPPRVLVALVAGPGGTYQVQAYGRSVAESLEALEVRVRADEDEAAEEDYEIRAAHAREAEDDMRQSTREVL